jgi:aminopeptidase YwaD
MSNQVVKVFEFIIRVKFYLIFFMTIFGIFNGTPKIHGHMTSNNKVYRRRNPGREDPGWFYRLVKIRNRPESPGQGKTEAGTQIALGNIDAVTWLVTGKTEAATWIVKGMRTLFLVLTTSILATGCQPKFDHQITTDELRDVVYFLASDSLKGRQPGTPEDSVLTAFIVEQLDISGMVPLQKTGLQEVKVEHGYLVTDNNRIMVGSAPGAVISYPDMRVLGFSATDTVMGELILSTRLPENSTTPVEGNILTMPLPAGLPGNAYDAYTFLRSQCLAAADRGATAVIYITTGVLPDLESNKRLPLPIPALIIPAGSTTEMLPAGEKGGIFGIINTFDNVAVSTGIYATIMTEVIPKELTTYNALAELKGGDKTLSDQYIIIGAHHDHLGMGGRGSSSRRQDTTGVHYGADDNASGVAGVIELSQHLMSRSPRRSFLFTTFAAEEMGLQGSRTLAANPVIDLEQVQVMINMDMIGRLNAERQLQIGGIGTSPVFRALLDSLNQTYNFSMAYSEAGYGPSDHSSFYAEDVPVLFVSTGAHSDYHTPADRPEKLNYEGMKEVLQFVSDLAYALSEMPEKIEFTLAGPKESSGSRGREGMVTFGLMPDVMYDGNEGMPVSFVTEGKPAAIGGMKGGDIITAVDGKSVGNVHDYMERLSELKEGQSVVVTVKRDGASIELLLQL